MKTKPTITITSYQPEAWSVRKDDIYAAISAIEAGIGYTQECIAANDRAPEINSRKDKLIDEFMKSDLRKMQDAHAALRLLPWRESK